MFALIFYISYGFGTASHGGPATLQGFEDYKACLVAKQNLERSIPEGKLDWAMCIPTKNRI